MALNLTDFARNNASSATGNGAANSAEKREDAKFWLNFGYIKSFKNDEGETDQVFVTLARGIPVDQIKEFDLGKVRNVNMATLRRDQNRFLNAIMAEAAKLPPGESKLIAFDNDRNLGFELRHVGDAATPLEEENDAPLPFSFG